MAVIHVQPVKIPLEPYWRALRLLTVAAFVTPAERRAITARIRASRDRYTRLIGRRRA